MIKMKEKNDFVIDMKVTVFVLSEFDSNLKLDHMKISDHQNANAEKYTSH